MAHVSDIKLIRTDTTLDLSQKAEKGMNCYEFHRCFYRHFRLLWYGHNRCGMSWLVLSLLLPQLSPSKSSFGQVSIVLDNYAY